MKVILSAAISLNGFIADENGKEDFLPHKNWLAFTKLAQKTGNFIYGRTTYESVISWEEEYLKDLKDVVKVVVSANKSLKAEKGFSRVNSPEDAISFLIDKGFKEALVVGGSSIYSYSLNHNLVDEIILDVNPVVLGSGKRLLEEDAKETKLELLNSKEIGEGIVEFHYKVIK